MDSTSPIAQGIAGQPSFASGSFFKPTFAMEFLTLVENLFVGRRWLLDWVGCGLESGLGRKLTHGSAHRRYRERHSHLAEGHGRAS
jgi:hypothetical protein